MEPSADVTTPERSGAPAPSASGTPGDDRRGYGRVAPVLLLLAGGTWFLAVSAQRLVGPFGASHDGRNGAVWGLATRALRELGPVTSRLGAVRADGATYVNHPPMLLLETALAETLAGEHPRGSSPS